MIAPGGHPRFVLSAATRRAVGRGEGSVNALADAGGGVLRRAPARAPPSRPARDSGDRDARDRRSRAGSMGSAAALLLGGASTHRRRSPQFRKLPRYRPIAPTPGRRASALVLGAGERGRCERVRFSRWASPTRRRWSRCRARRHRGHAGGSTACPGSRRCRTPRSPRSPRSPASARGSVESAAR